MRRQDRQAGRTTRRTFLAGIGGTAGGALLAGCIGDGGSDDSNDDSNRDDTGDDGPGGETGDDGETAESRLPDGPVPETCPAYDGVDRVVCYDAIADVTDAVDAFLDPSGRTLTSRESVEFTLRNGSEHTLYTNFYDWNVHKHVGGEWHHVAPRAVNQPLMMVPGGESHTWTVTVDNGDIEDGEPVPRVSATEDVALAGLGGGHYAFRARGTLEGHEDELAFAATFEFDAEPIALTPTNAVETTYWDGETLVAESSRGNPDGEYDRLGAYELSRVDTPLEKARTVITEQVLRNEQLRDTLALAHQYDADAVRLEEYDGTRPIFGSRTDGVVAFQGERFEVTTRELTEEE